MVPDEVLWQALERKQAMARATGLTMHIATQFGFDTRALDDFEAGLAAHGISCRYTPASPGPRRSPSCSSTPPIAGSGLP